MFSTVFDIETGSLDRDKVLSFFDEGDIKYGAMGEEKREQKKAAKRLEFLEKAALSSITGKVVAIGYEDDAGEDVMGIGQGITEQFILTNFWDHFEEKRNNGKYMVGFNIERFDLPFLIRRSKLLQVDVPEKVIKNNRWWSEVFIDIYKIWQCGDISATVKLDHLARSIGIQGKPMDMDGGDFAPLWFGTDEERLRAREYLINDLRMTRAVARHFDIA
jgi:hypothetical protein